MKMFLTRFGQNSRMVVCGDPKQIDIPGGVERFGLNDAVARLEGVEGIAMARFTAPATWCATRSSAGSSRLMRARMVDGWDIPIYIWDIQGGCRWRALYIKDAETAFAWRESSPTKLGTDQDRGSARSRWRSEAATGAPKPGADHARSRCRRLRAQHPATADPTGLIADKAFYDSLNDEDDD